MNYFLVLGFGLVTTDGQTDRKHRCAQKTPLIKGVIERTPPLPYHLDVAPPPPGTKNIPWVALRVIYRKIVFWCDAEYFFSTADPKNVLWRGPVPYQGRQEPGLVSVYVQCSCSVSAVYTASTLDEHCRYTALLQCTRSVLICISWPSFAHYHNSTSGTAGTLQVHCRYTATIL